jgi:hypothetical protein
MSGGLTRAAAVALAAGGTLPRRVDVYLHAGDPGPNGTANRAGFPRPIATDVAANGPRLESTDHLVYDDHQGDAVISWYSAWSGGACWWTGPFQRPRAVEAADGFVVPVGSVALNLHPET